jgi:hypothetical protein
MNYYKLGASSPAVNSRYHNKMIERAELAGVFDLPAPLPTVILYFLVLGSAII